MIRALCVSTQSTSGARDVEQLIVEQRAPEAVEWMRNPHEAALGANLGDRLRRWEVAWNVPFEEHADDVAVAGLDFLADDHRQLGRGSPGDVAGGNGALDPVVIGDRQVGQSAHRGGPHDRLGRRDGIK